MKFVVIRIIGVEFLSPLAEGRELKLELLDDGTALAESPLAEGRELKLEELQLLLGGFLVAPRGGA